MKDDIGKKQRNKQGREEHTKTKSKTPILSSQEKLYSTIQSKHYILFPLIYRRLNN